MEKDEKKKALEIAVRLRSTLAKAQL